MPLKDREALRLATVAGYCDHVTAPEQEYGRVWQTETEAAVVCRACFRRTRLKVIAALIAAGRTQTYAEEFFDMNSVHR